MDRESRRLSPEERFRLPETQTTMIMACRKYKRIYTSVRELDWSELWSIASLCAWRAAVSWRPKTDEDYWPQYLMICLKRRIVDEARRYIRRPRECSIVEKVHGKIHDSQAAVNRAESAQQLLQLLSYLQPRDREILERYASGETLQEIAGRYGISRERVNQIRWRAMEFLRRIAE